MDTLLFCKVTSVHLVVPALN